MNLLFYTLGAALNTGLLHSVEEGEEDMASWQEVLKENVIAIMQKSKLKPAN